MENKKAETVWYLLAIILGVMLIVAIVYFLFIGNQKNWRFFIDAPVNYTDKDGLLGLEDYTGDDLKVLNCKPVAELAFDKEREYFYFKIGDEWTNVYLDEDDYKVFVDIDKSFIIDWKGDVEIGWIEDGVIRIYESFLYGKEEVMFDYPDDFPNLVKLKALHNSFQLSGGRVWCYEEFYEETCEDVENYEIKIGRVLNNEILYDDLITGLYLEDDIVYFDEGSILGDPEIGYIGVYTDGYEFIGINEDYLSSTSKDYIAYAKEGLPEMKILKSLDKSVVLDNGFICRRND